MHISESYLHSILQKLIDALRLHLSKALRHLSRLVQLSDTAQKLDTTPRPKYLAQSGS